AGLPLRRRHLVVVVVTEDVAVDPGAAQELRVQVRVVRDVPDVEHPERPAVFAPPLVEPRERVLGSCRTLVVVGYRRCRAHTVGAQLGARIRSEKTGSSSAAVMPGKSTGTR